MIQYYHKDYSFNSHWSQLPFNKRLVILSQYNHQYTFQTIFSLKFLSFGDGKEWLWGVWRRPLLMLIYYFLFNLHGLFEVFIIPFSKQNQLKSFVYVFTTAELINGVQVLSKYTLKHSSTYHIHMEKLWRKRQDGKRSLTTLLLLFGEYNFWSYKTSPQISGMKMRGT